MEEEGTICHRGVVEKIEGKEVEVILQDEGDCGGCKLSKYCGGSLDKESRRVKAIDSIGNLEIGDVVLLTSLQGRVGVSLLLFFGVPSVMMMGLLFILNGVGGYSAIQAGGVSLLSVVIYYFLLGVFFRHRAIKPLFQAKKRV
ncbi:MAG TPA: hypothetical protein DDY68_02225 [Porphyromonadaceae bacterium]|nr:hypothetical protein [Porphyromonadaceae bacterium]